MIKIFCMNESDYVAAEDFESAVQWYMQETGLTREDATDGATDVVSSKAMKELKCFHEDDKEYLGVSFAEELKRLISVGQEFPCFFCSIEY